MIRYFGSITKENSAGDFAIDGAETCTATYKANGAQLVSLGLMRRKGKPFHKEQSNVLAEIYNDYVKTETLKIDDIEGSFTVFLADSAKNRLLLYRNLCGSSYCYYTQTEKGLFFGSNLADVARRSGRSLSVNESMLPVFFIYRHVPGKNTLFDGIYRLQFGELLSFESGITSVKRIASFASFDEPNKTNEEESIERVELTMQEILSEWMELEPSSAGQLSGGVDSTYIQVHWNEIWKKTHPQNGEPLAAALWLNHSSTLVDYEYTLSAVQETKSRFVAVRQEPLSVELMKETLAGTGEMPNHVQSFYFATLAKGFTENGIAAGISGQGADSIFGYYSPDVLYGAMLFKKKYPFAFLRFLLGKIAAAIGKSYSSHIAEISNILDDKWNVLHPLNSIVAFTDWKQAELLFGRNGIESAFRYRRDLLEEFCVPDDPFSVQKALGALFLGEASNTAALWSEICEWQNVKMFCPFLDSRMFRAAYNIQFESRFVLGNPKQVLKKALARHVSEEFINRPKRGFGQPIFEWLSPGGCLRKAAENIADYPFMPKHVKQQLLEKPNWILWSLLCFDLWHKEFIGKN